MKLVFYSDQIIPANRKVDDCLLGLLSVGARIGYVPSAPDPLRKFFRSRQDYYAHLGLALEAYCDPRAHSAEELAGLMACDAIHLSGGDTRHFLDGLIQADMLALLRRWAEDGRVLIGASAGAILLTPTIALDAIFRGADPAREPTSAALNLAPFEFFPHLDQSPAYLPALIAYSRSNNRPILACPDGDGVIVEDGEVEFIGNILRIENGDVQPL
jgi:dipeptidase E